MSDPFIGPLPYAELPAQPRFEVWCVDWQAYDVPRIWDILHRENTPTGWEQVGGFRQLSTLLVEHYRRLKSQQVDLSQAWQSPAAEALLSRMDSFAQSMLSDANCAMTTAHALDGIMTTYADAQVKVGVLEQEWNRVTTDWVPEWWDNAATELNAEAQRIMHTTDVQVRDYRTNIIIPRSYLVRKDAQSPIEVGAESLHGSHEANHVPPVPGYDPLSPAERGAQLASAPSYIPAVPGQPVSMLPLPPGNQFAPNGGAYILPGPGVGRGGYVVPMPPPSTGTGGVRGRVGTARIGGPSGPGGGSGSGAFPTTWRPGATAGGGGGAGMGMMPMPFGAPIQGGGQGSGYRSRPDTVWQVEKGVPPVIEPVGDDVPIPDQPSQKQEDAFKEWFAELAYPWRSANKNGSEPHIVLRRVAE